MKYLSLIFLLFSVFSCGRKGESSDRKIITVSIAPFKYFVEEIGGDNFEVNVMVPPGSDPHIYEPFPDQVSKLRRSEAYISNGHLDFETAWLKRFHEINPSMKKLSLGDVIEPLVSDYDGIHFESADPHYWTSPVSAMLIARSVRDLLAGIDPDHMQQINDNYQALNDRIRELDSTARELFSGVSGKKFMTYHPNLGYLARDYGLQEISVEHEGKEPSPARLMELVNIARHDSLKIILVQKEFDLRNAKVIADETGARPVIIDPLSENWLESVTEIINILYSSFKD